MMNRTEEEKNSESSIQHTILLDIPPRLQWENDNGYCGETAIQSFGTYLIILFNIVNDQIYPRFYLMLILDSDFFFKFGQSTVLMIKHFQVSTMVLGSLKNLFVISTMVNISYKKYRKMIIEILPILYLFFILLTTNGTGQIRHNLNFVIIVVG
jgi:hypothetical protein